MKLWKDLQMDGATTSVQVPTVLPSFSPKTVAKKGSRHRSLKVENLKGQLQK